MKIFHLLPQPDLTKVRTSTEFAANEKYTEPGSLLIPLEKRFPIQKDMPIQNPALGKDASLERSYKFLAELSVLDRELMMIAYRNAIAEGRKKRIKLREAWESDSQKWADNHAIAISESNQQLTILRGWIKRFHMEKVFRDLKVETMDDFKRLMQRIHHKVDGDNAHMHQLLLQQNGKDPSQMMSPTEWAKLNGRDEDMIRMKLNLSHKEILVIDEMRKRIAEQAASVAVGQNPAATIKKSA